MLAPKAVAAAEDAEAAGAGHDAISGGSRTGNVAMMKELIDLGADPKAKAPDGSGGVIPRQAAANWTP